MNKFLHVGCGKKRKSHTTKGFNTDDWSEIRFDIDPSVSPDIIGSMTDLSAIQPESIDAIYSSHNLEHLYPHEVSVALSEFRRVLKPVGFLVITCPDLQSVSELIVEDQLTEAAYNSPIGPIAPIDILYGHRASLASGKIFMAHKCGFTQKVLRSTLLSAEFLSIATMRRKSPYFDLWAIATKCRVNETTLRHIAGAHFP